MSVLPLVVALTLLCVGSSLAKWDRVRGTTATQISARGDVMPVYVVNRNKDLLRREFTSNGWEKERTGVDHVGAGFDDSAWLVTTTDEVYRGRNGNWQKVDGSLVQVSGRNFYEAIGVSKRDEIFHFIEEKWRKLPGKAVWAAIGIDGSKWVVSRQQEIFKWDHDRNNWTKVEGSAVNVDVYSAARIIVTSKEDEIFTWTGRGWKKEDGKCTQASITLNNIFCVKREDSGVYRN